MWIASLKRTNKISLGCQPIIHISRHSKENSTGVSVGRILGQVCFPCPFIHPSIRSSSPLPPLRQAWRHPPTAGGDEALPGWWQKSERGKKQKVKKFRGWQTTNISIRCCDNGKYLDSTYRHKNQSERHWQPHLLKPHLCVIDYVCLPAAKDHVQLVDTFTEPCNTYILTMS